MVASIARLARLLPQTLILEAARRARQNPTMDYFVDAATEREARASLLDVWKQAQIARQSPDALALALEVAAHIERERDEEGGAELVWSGPLDAQNDWRRTEPVLVSLIDGAKNSLWLVTFAAHRAPSLQGALERAAARGVNIHFVAETVEDSAGKLSYTGPILPAGTQMYIWPRSKRARDGEKVGLLHAKCAVADGELALISSANLTENALGLNIETGVLLRGPNAARLQKRLVELVAAGVWEEVG